MELWDLGLILMAAAAITLIFKKLKQPVVLGYLLAGFLVSPNFAFFPTVKDPHRISIWAEIGVIFMLFGLGLEFSFRKLAQVGKGAVITAIFEMSCMACLGYLVGQLMGWSQMDCLFLGGILAISSTTIIVRAFDELGLKNRTFAQHVMGILVVEDLLAVLLLAGLSSLASQKPLEISTGSVLALAALKLTFFLLLWFLLGMYLLPQILKLIKDLLTEETLLIVSLGLCLMMVIIAHWAGFSPALGAFVMGSLLSETKKGPAIEKVMAPVRNLFSAIFFVSVGMLIDVQNITNHGPAILTLVAAVILGKFICATLGSLLAGRSLTCSIQAGSSLTQIGEFSFIVATLGLTLNATSSFLYPVAVAVSAVTAFTTPFFIKMAEPLSLAIEKKLPNSTLAILQRYQTAMSTQSEAGIFHLFWETYGLKIILNGVLIVAMALGIKEIAPLLINDIYSHWWGQLASATMTLVVSSPFFWAIFFGEPLADAKDHSRRYVSTLVALRRMQFGVSIARFLIGTLLAAFTVRQFTPLTSTTFFGFLTVMLLGAFFFNRHSEKLYQRLENQFLSNLNAKELAEIRPISNIPTLAPWDATLRKFVLSPNSPLVLKTLQQSRLKETLGIMVTLIERGSKRIYAPKADETLLPGDSLYAIGTEQQLAEAEKMIETKASSDIQELEHFGLESVLLNRNHSLANKSIRESGLREHATGLIVGIERLGQRYLNPDSNMVMQEGDLIWIVGDRRAIQSIKTGG